jgi:hypothetical protein
MDEKIYSFFKEEYEKIPAPGGLKKRILKGERKKIFILAAISSSLFLVFMFSLFLEFSPTLDGVISNIVFP